jgi:hypothetical protein
MEDEAMDCGGGDAPRQGEIVPTRPDTLGRMQPVHYKIGAKLNKALAEYVRNGANATKAAQHAGMAPETVMRALKKQHVIERLEEIVRASKTATGIKALARIDALIDGAKSEYVQLEAAKTAADRAGHAPPKGERVQDGTLVVNINI